MLSYASSIDTHCGRECAIPYGSGGITLHLCYLAVQNETQGLMVDLGTVAIAPIANLDESHDDQTLMAQIASHDIDALTILVDRHQAYMMGLAMKALRDCNAAEAAVANVFDRVWHFAGRYNPDHYTVGAWLLGLTALQCGGLAATHAAVQVSRDDGHGYVYYTLSSSTS